MKRQRISSKVVRARSLAIYELEKFIEYMHSVDPELKPDEAIVLTAFTLQALPELFKQNPNLVSHFQELSTDLKLKRSANEVRSAN
ncbi:MAG: hypothetical protein V7L23_08015 [Nostoc sp.]|uniref:hypothetical protein n=1 Tax=Nostoc sp. TaxID=1180 RepID=UPI002FF2C88E